MSLEIGSVDYSKDSTKFTPKVYFPTKLNNGSNIYRILPPVGSLAQKNQYSVFYKTHAGYKSAPDENGKQRYFTFLCIEQRDRKNRDVITTHCPECDKIYETQNLFNTQSAELKKKGKSEEQVREALETLSSFLDSHFSASKYHLNAMDQEGKIGLLRLPSSCITGAQGKGPGGLRDAIEKLVSKYGPSCDPVGQKGAWFNFKKTGSGRYGTNYNTEVVMELKDLPPHGQIEVLKSAPLTDEIKARMANECHDLGKLYTKLTAAQIQQLVDSDGDFEIVEKIFGKGEKVEEDEQESSNSTFTNSDLSPDELDLAMR